MRVIKSDTNEPNYVYQIAYDSSSYDPKIYIRKLRGDGIWTPWQVLATMDKVGDIPNSELTNINTRLIQLETKQTATQKDLDELFQSVSNGKTSVANAITGKGVSTATNATFATMATNISKIKGYKEETKSYTFSKTGVSVLTLTFSANILAIKQIVAPSDGSRIIPQSSKKMFTINGKELTVYVTDGTWSVTAIIQA